MLGIHGQIQVVWIQKGLAPIFDIILVLVVFVQAGLEELGWWLVYESLVPNGFQMLLLAHLILSRFNSH